MANKLPYEYWVIVEQHNGTPFVDKLVSTSQKSFDEICEFLEEKYDLNWDRDNVSLIDPPEVIDFH